MSYGTLQNDRSQRKALESLLNGTAESLASKQDATLAPGALGPGSVGRSIAGKLAETVSVMDRGVTCDGVTDDSNAWEDLLGYLASITPDSEAPSRLLRRPRIYMPRGVSRVTRGFNVGFRGLHLVGDGELASAILWDPADPDSDDPVFDIGTFSTTIADVYTSGAVPDCYFSDLRIQHANPAASGSRRSQAIRQTSGGGLICRNLTTYGFKYGVNQVCGGDFCQFYNLKSEYCDVGLYLGPGSQQIVLIGGQMYFCREGMVLDHCTHLVSNGTTFNSSEIANIVIESSAAVDGSHNATRQLTSYAIAGTTQQSKLVFVAPWFESNADGQSTAVFSIPTHHVKIDNNAAETYRDITFKDPYIVSGYNANKTTTAFIGNTGSLAGQRVSVIDPVVSGALSYWFYGATSNCILRNPRTTTGYTPPTIANNTPAATFRYIDDYSVDSRTGTLPIDATYTDLAGANGVKVTYKTNGFWSLSFLSGGNWFERFLVDIQNRRLYLGGSTDPFITRGTGSPEGVLTAPVGSLYLRTDGGAGTCFYVKESGAGNTGWVAK